VRAADQNDGIIIFSMSSNETNNTVQYIVEELNAIYLHKAIYVSNHFVVNQMVIREPIMM